MKEKIYTAYRSSITGRIVTKLYAEANPDTTYSHQYVRKSKTAKNIPQPVNESISNDTNK